MLSNCRKLGLLALGLLTTAAFAPPCQAGPISEMIARHRLQRQSKSTVVTQAFTGKPLKDLNTANAGMTDRFKKRFALKKQDGPVFETFKPNGVIKTSQ